MTIEKTNRDFIKTKSGPGKIDLFEATVDCLLSGAGVLSVVWVYILFSL